VTAQPLEAFRSYTRAENIGEDHGKLGKTLGKHRKTEEISGDLESLWSFSTILDNFAGFHQEKLISARKLDVDH